MEKDLISICIANYNKGLLVEKCLESIKEFENIPGLEIVVVDDCSTDNSKDIITKWFAKNPNIRSVFGQNKKNAGPGTTYNHALSLSHGEYVSIIDSDDFLVASSLEEKRTTMRKNPNLLIVYGNGTYFDNDTLTGGSVNTSTFKLFSSLQYDPSKILNSIYYKIPLLLVNSVLIKTSFLEKIGGFDDTCFQNDRLLNIKIFQNINSKEQFDINEKIAFGYRIYDNNISKNYDNTVKVVNQVIDKYCPADLQHIAYANSYFLNCLSNLAIGQYRKAFLSMKKSMGYKIDLNKILLFLMALVFPKKILNKVPKKIINKLKSFILDFFQ